MLIKREERKVRTAGPIGLLNQSAARPRRVQELYLKGRRSGLAFPHVYIGGYYMKLLLVLLALTTLLLITMLVPALAFLTPFVLLVIKFLVATALLLFTVIIVTVLVYMTLKELKKNGK